MSARDAAGHDEPVEGDGAGDGPSSAPSATDASHAPPAPAAAAPGAAAAAAVKVNTLQRLFDAAGQADDGEVDDDWVREVKKALTTLQRSIARRRVRENFQAVISKARERFLDPDALAALDGIGGIERGKFYSDAALMTREGCWSRPEVQEALHRMWKAVKEIAGSPIIPREVYAIFYRKAYLTIADQNSDSQIDPVECMGSVEDDWRKDISGGRGGEMDEPAFKRCLPRLGIFSM